MDECAPLPLTRTTPMDPSLHPRAMCDPSGDQGRTLVHISAQPKPFLTQKHTLHTPYYPLVSPI